jgi:hypothetical protein
MIFQYMEEYNITNFGYVILFDGNPSLTILDDDHKFINDILIDDYSGLYNSINDNDIVIVGVNVKDDNGDNIKTINLSTENIEYMTYLLYPLYIYEIKTKGLTVDDLIDLQLIDMLFYDILDKYTKERIT